MVLSADVPRQIAGSQTEWRAKGVLNVEGLKKRLSDLVRLEQTLGDNMNGPQREELAGLRRKALEQGIEIEPNLKLVEGGPVEAKMDVVEPSREELRVKAENERMLKEYKDLKRTVMGWETVRWHSPGREFLNSDHATQYASAKRDMRDLQERMRRSGIDFEPFVSMDPQERMR